MGDAAREHAETLELGAQHALFQAPALVVGAVLGRHVRQGPDEAAPIAALVRLGRHEQERPAGRVALVAGERELALEALAARAGAQPVALELVALARLHGREPAAALGFLAHAAGQRGPAPADVRARALAIELDDAEGRRLGQGAEARARGLEVRRGLVDVAALFVLEGGELDREGAVLAQRARERAHAGHGRQCEDHRRDAQRRAREGGVLGRVQDEGRARQDQTSGQRRRREGERSARGCAARYLGEERSGAGSHHRGAHEERLHTCRGLLPASRRPEGEGAGRTSSAVRTTARVGAGR